MLLASGPTLLAVPLTTELHGRTWVAGAAVAFSLGCLLSTLAVELDRQAAVAGGAALVAVGPGHAGRLDLRAGARVRGAVRAVPRRICARPRSRATWTPGSPRRPRRTVTTALAYSASTRALGGSVAVKVLPMLVTAQAIGTAVSASVISRRRGPADLGGHLDPPPDRPRPRHPRRLTPPPAFAIRTLPAAVEAPPGSAPPKARTGSTPNALPTACCAPPLALSLRPPPLSPPPPAWSGSPSSPPTPTGTPADCARGNSANAWIWSTRSPNPPWRRASGSCW